MEKTKIRESLENIKNLCEKANQSDSETNLTDCLDTIIREAENLKLSLNEKKSDGIKIPDLSSFKALIVEDNAVNVMVAEAFLKKTGISIEVAQNGVQAVNKIEKSFATGNPFDIVFMDMHMPVMDGPEAIKIIRNLDSDYAKKIKIIAMTGSVLDSEISSIRKNDLNGYITKPVSSKILYSICEENLSHIREIKFKTEIKENTVNTVSVNKEKETSNKPTVTGFPDFSSKHILIVDDNKLNVEILNLMVKKTNAVIEDAFDGKEALEKFINSEENFYDMILMDIQMPVMDGNVCASEIRKSGRKDSNLPIIAISANAFQEDKDKSLKAGIDFHMSKPVNMKVLHEKMFELFQMEF